MSTFYIATTGNDTTGNGSESTPWLTLAKFLSSSTSGDTFIWAAGTYTWATATIANRTIKAATGATVIFNGAAGTPIWTLSGTVNLTELSFSNANYSGTAACSLRPTSGAIITLTRCKFLSTIVVSNRGNSRHEGGIISTNLTGGFAYTINLVSCLFDDVRADTTTGGYWFGHFGGNAGEYWNLTGCVFSVRTATNAVDSFFAGYNNNLAVGTCVNGIFHNATGTTIAFAINTTLLFFATMTANYNDFYNITTAPAGTGNITSDPLFYDAAAGNFNLRPTSPCIDAGTLV